MKNIMLFAILIGALGTLSAQSDPLLSNTEKATADPSTETFKVYGNCGMCKSRIEKAAKSLAGVTAAEWDSETAMVTVTFDPTKITLDEIHTKIASVGHDTDKVKAQDDVYSHLPGCCKYDRT
jgi:copper chaperone CopZ